MIFTHKSNLEQLHYLLTRAQQSVDKRELMQIKENAQQIVDIFCENSKNLGDVINAQKLLQRISSITLEKTEEHLLHLKLTKAYANIISSIQSSIELLLPILQRHQNRYLIILQKILLNPSHAGKILQAHGINDEYLRAQFLTIASIAAELAPADHELVVEEIRLFIKQKTLSGTKSLQLATLNRSAVVEPTESLEFA